MHSTIMHEEDSQKKIKNKNTSMHEEVIKHITSRSKD